MELSWLLERFQTRPDALAFALEDRRVTYGELVALVHDHESLLEKSSVGHGAIVAVVGDYTPEAFALLLALGRWGCIIVPLTRDSVVTLDAALGICGCDWLVNFGDGKTPIMLTRHSISASAPLLDNLRQQERSGLVFFSSGSTGKPKGILHDTARVAAKFLKQRPPVVAIPFLMFDHFGGFNTILAVTSSLGTVVSVTERSVAQVCRAIEKHRVELLPTTPSFLNLLIAARAFDTYDLSSLRRISYGTEVMPQATLKRLHEALPKVVLQQTYGLSEVGVLASKSRDDGSLWMRLGGDGFATKVVDGLLWIKSDFAMLGYLNAPSGFDADGWFNTQDKVEVDGDYFRVLGRVTDLINVGGQKVYPAEIEEVVMTVDNIVDVAVYAETNALLGNIIVARVVLAEREPLESVKARIRSACKQQLAAYKVPARVVISEGSLYTARHKKSRQAAPAP